jgi:hypothetical protein
MQCTARFYLLRDELPGPPRSSAAEESFWTQFHWLLSVGTPLVAVTAGLVSCRRSSDTNLAATIVRLLLAKVQYAPPQTDKEGHREAQESKDVYVAGGQNQHARQNKEQCCDEAS